MKFYNIVCVCVSCSEKASSPLRSALWRKHISARLGAVHARTRICNILMRAHMHTHTCTLSTCSRTLIAKVFRQYSQQQQQQLACGFIAYTHNIYISRRRRRRRLSASVYCVRGPAVRYRHACTCMLFIRLLETFMRVV